MTLNQTLFVEGEVARAQVTCTNRSAVSVEVQLLEVGGRSPSGTLANGPYEDMSPTLGAGTLLPGAVMTLDASRTFTPNDPLGAWTFFPTWRDAVGAYHDGDYTTVQLRTFPCAPKTCATLGKECGMVGNGCNDILDCGTCQSSRTCGVDNVCVGGTAAAYYVDCNAGLDTAAGTASAPWRSLGPAVGRTFTAGETLLLKRGCSWDGGFSFQGSGSASSPITLTAYGTGARPTLTNLNGGQWGFALEVTGNYVVVDGLLVQSAHESGVKVSGQHNVVQDVEATNVGFGFSVTGSNNLITRCNAHDLNMIVNTPGGDDDYGAVGYFVNAASVEISYSSCLRCAAPSFDYGEDGGFVEVWTLGDNLWVHHNRAESTIGFFEAGAAAGGSVAHVRIDHNILYNTAGGLCLHVGSSFRYGITADDVWFDHNTYVNTDGGGSGYPVLDCMDGLSITPATLRVRNNIFLTQGPLARISGITHSNNMYSLLGPETLGYAMGPGDLTGNPLFVNVNGDFHLQAASPAINAGANLGYTLDYDGHPMPQGGAPDIGALEYVP